MPSRPMLPRCVWVELAMLGIGYRDIRTNDNGSSSNSNSTQQINNIATTSAGKIRSILGYLSISKIYGKGQRQFPAAMFQGPLPKLLAPEVVSALE